MSVASAAFFGLNFGLLPSQGPRRGRWTPPHKERGCMWGSGRVLRRSPSSPRPSQGPEGRGRCRFVNLEALAEENRHDPTESEGVYRGQDTSHGTGCCCLVHLEAWKGAAVAALFISRNMSRRVDAAPRRARAFTRPSLPHPSRGPRRGGETRLYGERGRLQGLGRGPWRQPLSTRPSQGPEGRGCRCLVHLDARVEKGGRGPTKSKLRWPFPIGPSFSKFGRRRSGQAVPSRFDSCRRTARRSANPCWHWPPPGPVKRLVPRSRRRRPRACCGSARRRPLRISCTSRSPSCQQVHVEVTWDRIPNQERGIR